MSYEKVVTYTKTAESPADTFKTIPTLASVATKEQITALNTAYPIEWENRIILDQLVLHNTFLSKEDHDARCDSPIIKALQDTRIAWATANHLTTDMRVV
jgi:hypothetical protein